MKNIALPIILSLSTLNILAQNPGSLTWFGTTSVSEQDSFLVISTFGAPMSGISEQNNIIVNTDPYPFLLYNSLQTGTKELPLIEGLVVYPNPSSDVVYLKRKDTGEKLSIHLSQGDGVTLLEKHWDSGMEFLEIPFKNFTQGLYILTIVDTDNTKGSCFKLVKL